MRGRPSSFGELPAGAFDPHVEPYPLWALSVRQPWAWAILYLNKRIENRSRRTHFRGRIFLHAGLTVQHHAVSDLADEIRTIREPRPPAYCGALVGVAMIVDCVRPDAVSDDEQLRWTLGDWCWVLADVVPLTKPIAYRGQLGIFRINTTALPPNTPRVVTTRQF